MSEKCKTSGGQTDLKKKRKPCLGCPPLQLVEDMVQDGMPFHEVLDSADDKREDVENDAADDQRL